jgi:flavodoxin
MMERGAPNKKKKLAWIAAACAVAIGIAAVVAMLLKDGEYVASAPYRPRGEPNRDVAVVYYSRSGSSEALAREIARAFNAPIARIDADYPRGFAGYRKAVSDAKAHALPEIRVEPIDLRPARRVFLVSPTWMFGPSTPLLAYVARADLAGKEVVLVMTGDSHFEQSEVDAFAKRVEARGGRLVEHIFLCRGRFFWRKSREELLSEVRAEMEKLR